MLKILREETSVDLEHGRLPDPIAEAIKSVLEMQVCFDERLKRMEEDFSNGGGDLTPCQEGRNDHVMDNVTPCDRAVQDECML